MQNQFRKSGVDGRVRVRAHDARAAHSRCRKDPCPFKPGNFSLHGAYIRAEAAREVGERLPSLRLEKDRGKKVALESGPEDGEERRSRCSHITQGALRDMRNQGADLGSDCGSQGPRIAEVKPLGNGKTW